MQLHFFTEEFNFEARTNTDQVYTHIFCYDWGMITKKNELII
jgi:hypothetical protein